MPTEDTGMYLTSLVACTQRGPEYRWNVQTIPVVPQEPLPVIGSGYIYLRKNLI